MAEELYVNNIIITAIPFSSEKAELFTSYDNVWEKLCTFI